MDKQTNNIIIVNIGKVNKKSRISLMDDHHDIMWNFLSLT